jgi:hypothetical protein
MSVEVKVLKDNKVILGKDWKKPTEDVDVNNWNNPITEDGIEIFVYEDKVIIKE